MAVIVCGLAVTFRLGVVSWATPLVPTATAPRKEPLSSKTTWPVAVPEPGLLTLMVAVKVPNETPLERSRYHFQRVERAASADCLSLDHPPRFMD